jgi:hypothetical protein
MNINIYMKLLIYIWIFRIGLRFLSYTIYDISSTLLLLTNTSGLTDESIDGFSIVFLQISNRAITIAYNSDYRHQNIHAPDAGQS